MHDGSNPWKIVTSQPGDIDLNRFLFFYATEIPKNRDKISQSSFSYQILRCDEYLDGSGDFFFSIFCSTCAVMNLSKTYQTITENYDNRNYIIGLCIMYSFTW